MKEEKDVVTMKGNPLTLMGNRLKVGDRAPDFNVLDNNLNPVSLSGYKGKVCVLSSVPSLDTPVCDMETRRFNQEASGFKRSHSHYQHGPALCAEKVVRVSRG